MAPSRSIRWSSCERSQSLGSQCPQLYVRLSGGRQRMSEAMQALCFLAGAHPIFYGDKPLTTGNPDVEHDRALMDKLGISAQPSRSD